MLTLLFGAFVTDARGESLPDQPKEMPADSVSASTGSVSTRRAPIDPFMYRVQNRHLEKGADFYSDSIKWTDHISLGLFTGPVVHGGHVSSMTLGSRINFGRPIGVIASFQFSRLHGARLIYQNNLFKNNYRIDGSLNTHELGAGYMFNFTNYFKGYDPNKRFNVLATATAFADFTKTKFDGKRRVGARGEFGLLFNYRVLRNLSVFAEPYIGLTTDDYDHDLTPHRYDFLGGLRAGVATNGATKSFFEHVRNSKNNLYQPKFWGQHFFFGASGGRIWSNADKDPIHGKMSAESHVFLGYRFSPAHALRFQATYFKTPENIERKHHVMGELDYMINFTNMWRGYDPKRRFLVSGILGMGARYLEDPGKDDVVVPMAVAGLGFNYHLTPQISFFAEPYGGYALGRKGAKNTIFGGIRGGVQFDFIDTYTYMPHYALTTHEMEVASKWQMNPMSHVFYGASLGSQAVHSRPNNNEFTMPFNVFIGYRFTPVQSLRFMGSYIKTDEDIVRGKHTSFELDYMLNFSNLIYGYKENRRLNVTGFVGAGMRNIISEGTNGRRAVMISSGANVSYRLYKGMSLFLEPYVQLAYTQPHRYYSFVGGVNGGVMVDMEYATMYGKRLGGDYQPDWKNEVWRHFFVGGGGGITGVHTRVYKHMKTYPMFLLMGYRFSPNQALRLKAGYIKTDENIDRHQHVSAEVDYMLNFTNMFNPYRPNRLLNVMGYLGVGAKYLDNLKDRDGILSPMGTMGVDIALRIKPGLSVFAEPHLDIAKAKDQNFLSMYYGANLGLVLSFDELNAYSPRWGTPTAEWIFKPYQRLFFGGSAGYLRTQRVSSKNQVPVSLFMGYRFNPNHALRLRATYNKTDEKINRSNHVGGSLDYMFNASNMIAGYKPNRPLNLIGFIGLGVRNVEAENLKRNEVALGLMGNAGMDIAYRVTRNLNIFIEPYVGGVHSRRTKENVNFFMGVNGGIVLNLQDVDESYRGVKTNHNPIVEAAYGWMFPMRTGSGMVNSGLSLDVRLGTWLDPYFGVRGSLLFEHYGYSPYYSSQKDKNKDKDNGNANSRVVKGRVEGLFNPLNLSSNWRENADEKKFELNLAAGIELGVADKKYAIGKGDDKYGVYGITFAAQALYKVNPNTAIFIEPRYEHMAAWFVGSGKTVKYLGDFKHDNIATISGGVRVIRGTAEQRDDERRLNFEQSIFMMANVGGYKGLGYYKRENGGRLGKFGGLSLGFLITPVHGIKFNVQPSWYKVKGGAKPYNYTLMDYRLSYLLNFSNLYQSPAYRKVDFYWQAGVGLSTIISSPKGWKRRAPSASLGFLVAYNINKHWAITTEPLGQLVAKKHFLPGYSIKPRMAMMRADFSVGAMWKF